MRDAPEISLPAQSVINNEGFSNADNASQVDRINEQQDNVNEPAFHANNMVNIYWGSHTLIHFLYLEKINIYILFFANVFTLEC